MVKLIALYRQPKDPQKFDDHYYRVHAKKVARIPGLRKMKVTKITGSLSGASKYYLLCEMVYDDHDSMKAAMKTDEGKAVEKDLMTFASDLVTMMVGEETCG